MTQIQIRRDSSSRWTAVNPILESGELGVELDTHKMKAGDGVLAWNLLPYIGGNDTTALKSGDNVSELVNDVPYLVEGDVNQILIDGNYLATGDNVSELINDVNYLVSGDNVSELINDANYLVESGVNQILNDGGYITGVDNLDDIGDVSVAGATADQVLVYNGTNWVAQTPDVVTDSLQFQGSIDCTTEEAPNTPAAGWFYYNTGDGTAVASWTGITTVASGNRVVYGNDNQWHLLGNVNDGGSLTLDSLSVTVVEPENAGDLSYNNSTGVFSFAPADLTVSNVDLDSSTRTNSLQLASRLSITPPADFTTQKDANLLNLEILTDYETRLPKSMTEAEASDLEVYHNTDTNLITVKGVIPSEDAYTKVESDANYIGQNISSLPELPTD